MVTEWPRLNAGGTELLETWLETRDNPRLIIIDTLKKVRASDAGQRNIYDVDYEALEPLLPLAQKHNVAIVVVHHLRQLDADDPLDTISGSTGLTGGVDGAMVLKRERGRADAFLYVTHRDLKDDLEVAMSWDQLTATWASKGDAEEYRLSQERAGVLKVLREVPDGLSPKDIHEALTADGIKTSQGALRRLLPKMVADGQAKNPRYGIYTAATVTDRPRTSGNTGNSGNTSLTYQENPIIRGGNTGNSTGNSSQGVTDDLEGGNTLEPILEPSVTGITGVTEEYGNTGNFDRALLALQNGNAVRKVLKEYRDGDADLERLTRSVLCFFSPRLRPDADMLEEWQPDVLAAAAESATGRREESS